MKKLIIIFILLVVILLLIGLFFIIKRDKITPKNLLDSLTSINFGDNMGSINIPKTDIDSSSNTNKRRFAIDAEFGFPQTLDAINLIKDDLSELQGGMWSGIQPNAPIDGVAEYVTINDIDPSNKRIKALKLFLEKFTKTDRELSILIEFYNNDWAMEFHPTKTVQSPLTGERVPGFVRIKPEHHEDYKNFLKHHISTLPNVRYIQLDNEPENVWVDGNGYVEALRLSHEAIKEYNLEHKTDIKLLAAGFNLTPGLLINSNEDIKLYLYENYNNLDVDYVRQKFNLPSSFSSKQIEYVAQKIYIIYSVLLQENPPFDILTIHNDIPKNDEERSLVINWWLDTMKKQGYQRPLWIDDMHSGYYPDSGPKASAEDLEMFNKLKENNPQAVKDYNKSQPTWLVRKSVQNFSAGAERVKISQVVDTSLFFMPEWRYVGLFDSEFNSKASYYTTVLLVNKLDYFQTATKLEEDVYKFTFENKNDVYVAWSETGNKNIDLSDELGNTNVKVTFLVNTVDAQYRPIVRDSITIPSNKIPVTEEPVFIEVVSGAQATSQTEDTISEVITDSGLDSSRILGVGYIAQQEWIPKLYADAGIKWIKAADIDWSKIEPKAPINGVHTYKPEDLDSYIKKYQEKDFNIQIILKSDAPWAVTLGESLSESSFSQLIKSAPPKSDVFWKDYYDFVYYMVERYDGDGVNDMPGLLKPILYFEIESEAQHKFHWNGEVADYIKLLKTAKSAARAANPKAKIILSGMNFGDIMDDNPSEAVLKQRIQSLPAEGKKEILFLQQTLAEDDSYDLVEFHYNRGIYGAEPVVNFIRKYTDKPIWGGDVSTGPWMFTQFTQPYGTRKEATDWFNNIKNKQEPWYSEYQKLKSETIFKKTVIGAGLGMERLNFETTNEWVSALKSTQVVDQIWYIFAMANNEGKPYPAYYALKQLSEKIDGFSEVSRINVGNEKAYVYKFVKNGKLIVAAWTEGDNKNLDLSKEFGNGNVKITYLVGQVDKSFKPILKSSIIVPSNSISLTKEPIFIEKI